MPFKFRESERETLLLLLEDCYLLEPQREESALLRRLKAAHLVEPVEDIDPLVAWGLTPEGKETVKRALG